jgi:hypothetical protein
MKQDQKKFTGSIFKKQLFPSLLCGALDTSHKHTHTCSQREKCPMQEENGTPKQNKTHPHEEKVS